MYTDRDTQRKTSYSNSVYRDNQKYIYIYIYIYIQRERDS